MQSLDETSNLLGMGTSNLLGVDSKLNFQKVDRFVEEIANNGPS